MFSLLYNKKRFPKKSNALLVFPICFSARRVRLTCYTRWHKVVEVHVFNNPVAQVLTEAQRVSQTVLIDSSFKFDF